MAALPRPVPALGFVHAERATYLLPWQHAGCVSRRRRAAVMAAAGGGGSRQGRGAGAATSSRSRGSPCHYEVLGLPRSATREEVKRSFRRLARLWHPDVNPSPAASAHFQVIARAFEVLSDEQQRRRYDQVRWGAATGTASRARPRRGSGSGAGLGMEHPPPDLHAVLHLDFREAALGAQRSVVVDGMDACRSCDGTGAAAGTAAVPCACCKGRREIMKRQRVGPIDARNHGAGHMQFAVCCPICAGRGYSVAHPCLGCAGTGLARQPRAVAVRVPPGAEQGGRLRLAGEGDVARVGGPRGGLVLELQVAQGEGMWRQGLDLRSQLAVPLWDAVLGGTATVTTLRGAASLTIPPGTQHGAVLSLAHAGVEQEASSSGGGGGGWAQRSKQPCRGSHHFEVLLQVPREVTRAEQALLQRLAELQGQRQQQARQGDGGRAA